MAGRPPKWETPEQLQKDIDKYFMDCEATGEPLTITGLAMALGTYRETLMNYQEKDDEFFDTVKKAKQRIENAYEKRLIKYGRSGDIFALKNFNWTDKQEVEAKVDSSVDIKIELSDE